MADPVRDRTLLKKNPVSRCRDRAYMTTLREENGFLRSRTESESNAAKRCAIES
ncbi:hypothetical protein [Microcoleus vaginatus]|uniref:hypothetical protein n=1 Tax=Microcoleus vaginatus TaxID=119532 RepID=UPI0032AD5392